MTAPMMFRFLQHLFRTPELLDPEILGDNARNVAFRVMEENDIVTCMSFYRANEAHFPRGQSERYEAELRRREFLTLMATRDDKPVGCCGINYMGSIEGFPVATLCFGMVDPAHQRRGIGTAQVLVRFALLTPVNGFAIVAMNAVPDSIWFYRRFGFDFSREARAADGGTYPFSAIKLPQSLIDKCRLVLAERNITYPDVRGRIPNCPLD